jgi:hypothetical protein
MSDQPTQSPPGSPAPDRGAEPSPDFAGDLRSLYRPPIGLPPEVDRAILEAAQARFRSPRRPPAGRRAPWGRVAAAALVVGALLGLLALARWGWKPERADVVQKVDEGQPVAREDLDRSGRVDVLDAFLLARRIEGAPAVELEPSWDLNGDGRVDHEDVRTVAMVAVRLH